MLGKVNPATAYDPQQLYQLDSTHVEVVAVWFLPCTELPCPASVPGTLVQTKYTHDIFFQSC